MIIEGLDTHIDRRGTHSVKWDTCAPGELPLWVADMDFAPPKIVEEAIIKRLHHPTLGYSFASKEWHEAVKHWCQSQQGWRPGYLVPLQGVMTGIHGAVLASTKDGDTIIIHSPVYHPFTSIPKYLQRPLIECPLKVLVEPRANENGDRSFTMTIDWDQTEDLFRQDRTKALIMSSPHNPGGMIWSSDDLIRLGKLAYKYDVTLIADEIHADTLRVGGSFISYGKLIEERVWGDEIPKIIVIQAPTKTFSLAGISSAWACASTLELAQQFEATIKGLGTEVINILSYEAATAVYTRGHAWLGRVKEAINHNLEYLQGQVRQFNLNKALSPSKSLAGTIPDATYLYWLYVGDCGGSDSRNFVQELRTKGARFNPGAQFGTGGEGFIRINVACHLDYVKQAWAIIEGQLEKK